jgi:hypothetical protein
VITQVIGDHPNPRFSKFQSKKSHIDSQTTCYCSNGKKVKYPGICTFYTNLLAPPASGETMTDSFQFSTFSFIHFNTAGSAYRLSTGMSKKPYSGNILLSSHSDWYLQTGVLLLRGISLWNAKTVFLTIIQQNNNCQIMLNNEYCIVT